MCGIAGIFNLNQHPEIPVETLKKMLIRVRHRGPDENGIYLGKGIGLGNVRLSILDLTTGQQPLSDESGNFWIVYNGEIFNYVELRKDLISKGYRFKTTSDTEVLVQLYAIYGEKCLSLLNGQFAFAIWDHHKRELFLARDRVGIRPLYYYKSEKSFIFSSEIKSIFEHREVQPVISEKALLEIFTFWTTLTPATVFNNIFELPPGHFMRVNEKSISIHKYWELSFSDQKETINLDHSLEKFGELFYDAVKIRLRADVPVAAYLSGGLDSTTTTAVIKDLEPSILQSFSVGFAEESFDETAFQQEASSYLKTNHTGFICTNKDIADVFQSVVWHSEIPLLRTAPAPMYILSRLVRENNIKVVITGEGADEILAGYDIFKETMIRHFWAKYPKSIYRPLLLKKLYPYIPQITKSSARALSFFYGYQLENTDSPYYSHILRWNNNIHIKKYLSSDILNTIGEYDPIPILDNMLPAGFNSWDPLSKAQWLESTIFLSGYLLAAQGDRMGMANSVEGRYPFLDYRLIEFCALLPSGIKLKGLNEKYFLKKYINNRIPESIVKRAKQAYRAPIAGSLLYEKSPGYFHEMLSESKINKYGLFNFESVNSLIQKMKQSLLPSEIENMALTAILSCQILKDMFIESNKPPVSEDMLQNTKIIQK